MVILPVIYALISVYGKLVDFDEVDEDDGVFEVG